jgi:Ribbon-helix-helix protein, copG family.
MRKNVTLSLDEDMLAVLDKRALRRHLSRSRVVEELLRKVLRMK